MVDGYSWHISGPLTTHFREQPGRCMSAVETGGRFKSLSKINSFGSSGVNEIVMKSASLI